MRFISHFCFMYRSVTCQDSLLIVKLNEEKKGNPILFFLLNIELNGSFIRIRLFILLIYKFLFVFHNMSYKLD